MVKYIVVGTLFYLIFLVVTVPASLVYPYWKEYFGKDVPVQISGLDGSIWSGKASTVAYSGQKFQPLKWSFQPLNILLGQVALDWEFTLSDGYGKGRAGYSMLGGYFVKNIDAWVPVKTVAPMLNMGGLRPDGKLSIKLDELHLEGNTITAANGNLEWHDAEITMFKKVQLGSYHVDLLQEGDIISGVLKDKGGPIEASGQFTLTPQGDYELNGLLSVRDAKRADLKQALSSMGRPNREGKITLSQKGNISQLGIF